MCVTIYLHGECAMNYFALRLKKITIPAVVFFCFIIAATQIYAQGKQAVIILKPTTAGPPVSDCDGISELNYQILNDIKLNNKEEVRLVGSVFAASSSVSRKDYENAGKSKLSDLSVLKFDRNGLLYAVSINGQAPILALPEDMKPQKNSDQSLSSFYSVIISGETPDKQKRKVSLSLQDILKIYFVSQGSSVNDILFKHASEEKSVALWEAYLKKTNNHRNNEANAYMCDALVVCAKADFDSFLKGNYGSLDKARQKSTRAQSVKDDDATRQLSNDIRQAQEKLDNIRNQVDQAIRASNWDEAITSAEPIKIYLKTWPDLENVYNSALKRSHEKHLFKGEEALRNNQLEVALEEYSMALQRLPDSGEARAGKCEAQNKIVLRDSTNYRQQKHLKDAKELLEKQLADSACGKDARIIEALKATSCEYTQQLFAEARQLVVETSTTRTPVAVATPPKRPGKRGQGRATQEATQQTPTETPTVNVKSITAQNKTDFSDARTKLTQASQLCTDEPIETLLNRVNSRLSEYCLNEARKAMQRNEDGTAYVYLQTAQGYTPNDENVLNLFSQARERFEGRTRISIGVLFKDVSRSNVADQLLNEITAEIESVVNQVGLAQPVILSPNETAQALRNIQSGKAPVTPIAIFSGDLLGAGISRRANQRPVRSSFSYSNPQREEWDRKIDMMNRDIDNCKKQNGDAACNGLRSERERMRAYRDSLPRNITENYSYNETTITAKGSLKMSVRFMESISRSVRASDTIEASVDEQCVQREGVNEKDYSARNSTCNTPDEQTYFEQMLLKAKSQVRTKAYSELKDLPLSYYTRAKSSANNQQAVEDYIRFLFLTNNKKGSEAVEAQKFLVSYDPELKTDGVFR